MSTKVKSAAKKAGNGFLTGLCIIADAQNQTRINQIDVEVQALQEQIDRLNEERSSLSGRMINR
jgi:outer membrane murein-binding lipoprotein Lpp